MRYVFFFVLACMRNTSLFPACTLHFQWLRCRGVVAGVCESASLYLAVNLCCPMARYLHVFFFFVSLLSMSKTRLFPACICKHAQFQWLRCRGVIIGECVTAFTWPWIFAAPWPGYVDAFVFFASLLCMSNTRLHI